MSNLTIIQDQFLNALPDNLKVGDRLTLTVTGTVRRIEADEIDITPLGSILEVAHGRVEVELTVTALAPSDPPR